MKKIRKGKDIAVTWRVTTNGQDISLVGQDLVLKVWSTNVHPVILDYSVIEPNTLSFIWHGEKQPYAGIYYLSLFKRDSPKSIVDTPFVQLVDYSWAEEDAARSDIQTESIELESSSLTINGDYNQLANKPSINGVELVGNIELRHPYLSLERLRPYLYRVTFDALPEDNGDDGFVPAGCSSFVQDGKLYRNLDFNYDTSASFIVRTKDFEGISFITGLNDGSLDDELIAQLPYRVVDGCNNSGIKVSTHVLYNDWQWTGSGDKSVSLTRLPYLVLSRVKSMASIASDLDGVLDNLYASEGLLATGYLIQVLVTDGTTTYAILPPTSEGEAFLLQDITSNPKLANFRWVDRPAVTRSDSDIQTRPTGIERWNMMPCPLADLRFTKAYESADRLTEFIGLRETTKASSDEELTAIYNDAHVLYLDRQRDGKTWQTMHSVVYGNSIESLFIQENWNDNCVINLADTYSKEEADGKFATKTEVSQIKQPQYIVENEDLQLNII